MAWASNAPCVACGQMVTMVKMPKVNIRVAMDPAPVTFAYYTLDEYGRAQRGGALVEHTCDVDVLVQFQSSWMDDAQIIDNMNAQALANECPKCGAAPGASCLNLLERKNGRDVATKMPHSERYTA